MNARHTTNQTWSPGIALREVIAAQKGTDASGQSLLTTRLRATVAFALRSRDDNGNPDVTVDDALWLANFIARTDPTAIVEPCDDTACA